jgi:hypothetical protein
MVGRPAARVKVPSHGRNGKKKYKRIRTLPDENAVGFPDARRRGTLALLRCAPKIFMNLLRYRIAMPVAYAHGIRTWFSGMSRRKIESGSALHRGFPPGLPIPKERVC